MKFIKKCAMLMAVCLGLSNYMPAACMGEEARAQRNVSPYGFVAANELYATHSSYYVDIPVLSQQTRNSDTYLCISVNQPDATVYVNGSTSGVIKESRYGYAYRVTKEGRYEVRVSGYYGGSASNSIYISNVSNDSTELELSKEYKNGNAYLIIDASDDDGIKKVTVNGSSISFNRYSGEVSYRVYNTGTYEVKLTDEKDNVITKSIYINVDDDDISLDVSKTYRSGDWYLVIKADSDNKIKQVTVNGEIINFPTSGGTEEYRITKSGTYKVIVRDKAGYTETESYYINVDEKTNTKPVVKVSQNYKQNNVQGWYLLIDATDDGSIYSVTVNGTNVPFDAVKGQAQYYVPVDGTYTIVVTDNEGNTYTTSTYAAGNAGLVNNTNSNVSSIGSTKVVFEINKKTWTKDGVIQSNMDVSPKIINSRTYLPLRYTAYALGIDPENISWNQADKTVTFYNGIETTKVTVGSKVMYVNGRAVQMDAAPVARNGRVMLPISQISSAFSNAIQIDWDNSSKKLTITR